MKISKASFSEDFEGVIFPQIKTDLRATPERGALEHLKALETADPRAFPDCGVF
jgi:hypothetical protein